MKVKAALILVLVIPFMPLAACRLSSFAFDIRHSGAVLEVGPDRLVVDELGLAGREQKLDITVTSTTRLVDSQRNPNASGTQDLFTEKTIALSDIKMGDFVVVEVSREGKRLVAESVMVTLRGSQK